MNKGWCTLLVIFAIHTAVYSQNALIEAWVKSYEEADDVMSFTGFVKNLAATVEGLNYTMEISKADHKGQSRNIQSGTFTLEEDGVEALSTVRFNKVANQAITIELIILDQEEEVARAVFESDASDLILTDASAFKKPKRAEEQAVSNEIVYPSSSLVVESVDGIRGKETLAEPVLKKVPTKTLPPRTELKKADVAKLPIQLKAKEESIDASSSIDDLEIDGLIINETRSKTGRDFYGFFYRKWQAPAEVNNFTIVLKEFPTRGRVARVGVEVNGTLVFRPVLQPRQDIVEMSADQAISIVSRYLLDQKKMKNQIDSEDQSGSGLF